MVHGVHGEFVSVHLRFIRDLHKLFWCVILMCKDVACLCPYLLFWCFHVPCAWSEFESKTERNVF